jgi:hypothetical protein
MPVHMRLCALSSTDWADAEIGEIIAAGCCWTLNPIRNGYVGGGGSVAVGDECEAPMSYIHNGTKIICMTCNENAQRQAFVASKCGRQSQAKLIKASLNFNVLGTMYQTNNLNISLPPSVFEKLFQQTVIIAQSSRNVLCPCSNQQRPEPRSEAPELLTAELF